MTTFCPHCGAEVSEDDLVDPEESAEGLEDCPECGASWTIDMAHDFPRCHDCGYEP